MDYWSDEDPGFEHFSHCYPVSIIDKLNLETGDKIIMPPSALDELASVEIEYPMLFEMRNISNGRVSHCGVLEFTAEEGKILYQMMENMHLQAGDFVILRSTSLAKGTFFKLQPHTKDFLDISNPKAILETSLRSFSCLTTGDTIMIAYNKNKYYIHVVETKPSHAISIIETDCEVDFAQPLKEPERQLPSASYDRKSPEVEDKPATRTGQFIPFSGSGRRLDGKPSTQLVEQASSSVPKQQEGHNETKSSDSKPSNIVSSRTSGKLVFGSKSPKASLKTASEESS